MGATQTKRTHGPSFPVRRGRRKRRAAVRLASVAFNLHVTLIRGGAVQLDGS